MLAENNIDKQWWGSYKWHEMEEICCQPQERGVKKLHYWTKWENIYPQLSSKINHGLDASCLLQGNQVSIKNPKEDAQSKYLGGDWKKDP